MKDSKDKTFLRKLGKEKKIVITESSEEIKKAYIARSGKALHSSKVLFEIEDLEDSVALAYYSMYYSLLSLLLFVGVKCENHTAAIILLEKVFNIDNGSITHAKKERIDKQYYIDFSVTSSEVFELIEEAEQFNGKIVNFIDSLTTEHVKKYREKIQYLIS